MVICLSSPIFPCLFVCLSRYDSTWPNLHFFWIYTGIKALLTSPVPLNTSSTKSYWPSTTRFQPVWLHTDPVPPSTNHYCLVLTDYHHVSTSSAPYWLSTTKNQPVRPPTNPVQPSINQYCLPSTDPEPPRTDQYHPLLTQYHQVPTSTAPYWPSTIIYHIEMSDFPLSTWHERSCTLE